MGCKYLADAISKDSNPDLQLLFLDLRNNNIDSEGAIYLAEALKSNTTITTLDLRWNKVSTYPTYIHTYIHTYIYTYIHTYST